jgi:hypothetical protein
MNSALFEAIDNYCERTGPEFWSEPLNALTNLAFIAAGIWGIVLVRRHETGAFAALLAWWAIVIGVGSALFHTFANRLTVWADVVPIALFIFMFALFSINRFLGFVWPRTIAIFVVFIIVTGAITWAVPDWLRVATNGSTGYLPAPLGLLFFGAWLVARGHPAGRREPRPAFRAAGKACARVGRRKTVDGNVLRLREGDRLRRDFRARRLGDLRREAALQAGWLTAAGCPVPCRAWP